MTHKRGNVFLTGASSGIGALLARQLILRGYEVWGTSRHPEQMAAMPKLHPLMLQLEAPDSITRAWEQALVEAGEIDLVIQNAGEGLFGVIEEMPKKQSDRLWAVLVIGPLLLLQLAAAHLRPRRCGMIIGISSLAAELPTSCCAHYSAGKAAFSALLAGLWMELRPFGVGVVDLRPGDLSTDFDKNAPSIFPPQSPYAPWLIEAQLMHQESMRSAPSAAVVADAVLKILSAEYSSPVARVGNPFQAILAPLGPRFLPKKWLLHLIRRTYGQHRADRVAKKRNV